MDSSIPRTRRSAAPTFEDGFGRRYELTVGENLFSALSLADPLVSGPGVDVTLREQLTALAALRHPAFARVHRVARVAGHDRGLALLSDHVRGERLSILLAAADKHDLPLDVNAAIWIIGQLVSAMAAMHQEAPGAFHGAIAPERIVITPEGRLVLVEHVMGPCIAQLQWTREQYWRTLRVALPPRGDVFFDQGADVAQIGAVALALLQRRPLGDDYRDVATNLDLLPDGLRLWMSRALQLNPDDAFASAAEASAGLNHALNDSDYFGGPDAAMALLSAFDDIRRQPAPPSKIISPEPLPLTPPPVPSPAALVAVAVAAPVSGPATVPVPAPVLAPSPDAQGDPAPLPVPEPLPPAAAGEDARTATDEFSHEPDADLQPALFAEPRWRHGGSIRWKVAAAAALVVLVATATTYAARHYLKASVGMPAVGTLALVSDPPGANVVIDGQLRGATPLHLELPAGEHVVEMAGSTGRRTLSVSLAAGQQLSHLVEMPTSQAAAAGQLQVRTDPSGARVFIDGLLRGVAPLTVGDLAPGTHAVRLESDRGSVTEEVTVSPGVLASLVVPMGASPAAALTGWIAVRAPAEVQLYENGQLLGTSRSERIMAPVGRHQIELVNEALGYRVTRPVTISGDRVSTIVLDWPEGTLALNALPWADVWIDGERVGETPLGSVSVPLGRHEVVFRHPDLGEQSRVVTVTTSPQRLSVDLRRATP